MGGPQQESEHASFGLISHKDTGPAAQHHAASRWMEVTEGRAHHAPDQPSNPARVQQSHLDDLGPVGPFQNLWSLPCQVEVSELAPPSPSSK